MSETTGQLNASVNLINVRVPGYPNLQQILIRQGEIVGLEPMEGSHSSDVAAWDLAGDWVSLGGIDLQINGALGLAFPDVDPQNQSKLHKICQYLWHEGIDGFLPTIVTTTVEKIQRSLATFAEFVNQADTAQILGVHLEGPFLNPTKRGAHPAECLLPLTLDQVKRVLGDYTSLVKVITLAPELDSTGKVIPYLRNLGMTVSLGHSLATATQAQQAFQQGASMVTHAFNAMPSLHHREPGLLGAALVHPNVQAGLIADGEHVCPVMLDLLVRAMRGKNSTQPSSLIQGLFLVSDALAPLGLPDGVYPWDQRQIEVKQGTARLLDGTLSGTTLPLLVGVQNLVNWGICEVEEAITLATNAPRQAIGIDSGFVNQPATQLLRWQSNPQSGLTWQRLYS